MKTKWPVHSQNEIDAVAAVLQSGKTNYWTGSIVQEFEKQYAASCGVSHGLAVTNGTTALELALRGVGIGPGDTVVVPARTFIATAAAAFTVGATPRLADIDQESLNVTKDTIEAACTPGTKAVIVVHFAGLPVDMEPIVTFCVDNQIALIEDCAHAHGATYRGEPVGSLGDVGCFSFCQGKIISTGGEGGMVVTDDYQISQRMTAFRDHGRYQMAGDPNLPRTEFQWTVDEFGSNLRMTEMQAAIGKIQLKNLPSQLAVRRQIADEYNIAFRLLPNVILQHVPTHSTHSYYLYLMRVPQRKRVLEMLHAREIPAGLGGCPNIGHEQAFNKNGIRIQGLHVADHEGAKVLSLPVYPTMSDEDVVDVISNVCDVVKLVQE